jgi:hypothetical protein
MNIFVLHEQPWVAAEMHVDKHVVKMIVESAQMLSTAHAVLDGEQVAYKPTHINHPCSKWVRESVANYQWLYSLFRYLSQEYTHRYGKVHKTWLNHGKTLATPPKNIPEKGSTPFALAMPDQYKDDNPVTAYRKYYLGEKAHIFKWKDRSIPEWVDKTCISS